MSLETLLRELVSLDLQFAMEVEVSPASALSRVARLMPLDGSARTFDEWGGIGRRLRAIDTLNRPNGPVAGNTAHVHPSITPQFPQCDSEPPQGWATLKFTNTIGSTQSQISSRTLNMGTQLNANHQPFVPAWSLGPQQLNTAGFTLDSPNGSPPNPVEVAFSTTPALSVDLPAEAQLFARDPEELGQFADTLETDPETIRQQVATWRHPAWAPQSSPFAADITLPDALSLVSPAMPSRNPAVVRLTPADFFGSRGASFTGNTASNTSGDPSGFGSVKAARVNYPGLCTLEQLYDRPTPAVAGVVSVAPFASIFQNLETHIRDYAQSDMCPRYMTFGIEHVIAFPLLRSNANLGDNSIVDSRGQLFVSIKVKGIAGWLEASCTTQASVIYDIKLDARGGLVLELARKPILSANSLHSPNTIDARTGFHNEAVLVEGAWVDNLGRVETGPIALRVVDDGGGPCNKWDFWDSGTSQFAMGLNSLVVDLLTQYLPKKLNADFRQVQMFPRASERQSGAFNQWGCDTSTLHVDPQRNLFDTRKAFFPNVPVSQQTETGFGFISQSDQNTFDNCAGARNDFCNNVRRGFAALNGGQPANCLQANYCALHNLPANCDCCAITQSDPLDLQFLLQAVTEKDIFGNWAHWGCEGLDPGNQDCLSAQAPMQLICSPTGCGAVPGSFAPPPGWVIFGTVAHCPSNVCVSRAPGQSPPPYPGFSSTASAYGCEPLFRGANSSACFFLPPARRVIANPDGIQLVFYDNDNDCSNASLALRYAMLGYNLSVGTSVPFPNTGVLPSPDYLAGIDLPQVGYQTLQNPPVQGRWRQAYQVPMQPIGLCNYNRFNDLEDGSNSVGEGGVVIGVTHDYYGHQWRPFSFPRPFAVYAALPQENNALWAPC